MNLVTRLLAWLIGLPVAVIAVVFAVSNRDTITIGIWPLGDGLAAPVYVVALIPFALGLLLGAGLAGLGTMRHRMRAGAHARRAQSLEREISRLKTAPPAIPAPTATRPTEPAAHP